MAWSTGTWPGVRVHGQEYGYMAWSTWPGVHGLVYMAWSTWPGLHGLVHPSWYTRAAPPWVHPLLQHGARHDQLQEPVTAVAIDELILTFTGLPFTIVTSNY